MKAIDEIIQNISEISFGDELLSVGKKKVLEQIELLKEALTFTLQEELHSLSENKKIDKLLANLEPYPLIQIEKVFLYFVCENPEFYFLLRPFYAYFRKIGTKELGKALAYAAHYNPEIAYKLFEGFSNEYYAVINEKNCFNEQGHIFIQSFNEECLFLNADKEKIRKKMIDQIKNEVSLDACHMIYAISNGLFTINPVNLELSDYLELEDLKDFDCFILEKMIDTISDTNQHISGNVLFDIASTPSDLEIDFVQNHQNQLYLELVKLAISRFRKEDKEKLQKINISRKTLSDFIDDAEGEFMEEAVELTKHLEVQEKYLLFSLFVPGTGASNNRKPFNQAILELHNLQLIFEGADHSQCVPKFK